MENPFILSRLSNPNEYRGFFITEFARLERIVDLYLARFFADDEHHINTLISVLIDRINFDGKVTAFRTLLDRKNIQDAFLNNVQRNKKLDKKILDGLRSVAQCRNQFAHYHILDRVHDPKIVIGLIQFRDSTNLITFTHEQFEKKIAEINNLKNQIRSLLEEISRGEDLSSMY